ncbi:uncharacterized protein UV8b_04547 [Ustilaginoidea virens]|uniref:Uncharacterized protein n=1 Tax=Ustilaginoidea virens TaxID=1159556 RepID=A0A8E5HRN9_USTVR|nr:uncharacterized protein UV8b_04547 [Ustilaginoidea virens]QUC20306.1 hypothetical protein UV8b_04547 [Ustilaginoidea virens]
MIFATVRHEHPERVATSTAACGACDVDTSLGRVGSVQFFARTWRMGRLSMAFCIGRSARQGRLVIRTESTEQM